MRSRKAAVLLSGGLDSATCLGVAVERLGNDNVFAMTVSYGQRHEKETECACAISRYYGVTLENVDLSGLFLGSRSTLIDAGSEIPEGSYDEQANDGMVSTYVPFRNGLMISAIASRALSIDQDSEWDVYVGVHSDDTAGDAYPDCSEEFINDIDMAVRVGTFGLVHVVAPFAGLHKSDVVAEGIRLGVPYELTWSCYKGGERQCGACATCLDRKKAFEANGEVDPVPYEA